jgi:hypothetical protein
MNADMWCRIITGKVGLNGFLYKINRSNTPYCKWCEEREEEKEETVDHFLIECPHYQRIRELWRAAINILLPHL